ncbi:MAG: hypothetical protein IH830_12035 [Planctomycetes bacterium]|nr:hypothetical protein [Planctomycetota bacterium]
MLALLRTSLMAGVFCGLVLVVFWRLSVDQKQRAIEELEALNEQMQQRLAAKDEMIDRLNRTRRLAHVRILDQSMGADGQVINTDLVFIELDDDGGELARQRFTLPGDVLFVDAWSVKFDRQDVAQGHPLRGRSLLLLRRIYSDRMAPINGYAIDTPGAVPPGYATGEVAEFEKRLWEHFWQIATDAKLAKAMGVRVAQGEAVYKPVRKGQVFELIVDAVGGMSLTPLPADDLALSPSE